MGEKQRALKREKRKTVSINNGQVNSWTNILHLVGKPDLYFSILPFKDLLLAGAAGHCDQGQAGRGEHAEAVQGKQGQGAQDQCRGIVRGLKGQD